MCFYTNYQFYFKQFSLACVHNLIIKNTSISSYPIYKTVLIQPLRFSIRIDFVYTQLNVKTVLFQTIQFCISMQFKYQNSSVSSNSVLHTYAVESYLTHRYDPIRTRVDLGAMALKGCSAFPESPVLLEPHHQIV